VYANGYGYADLEHDARITETTPFQLASLSKQLTAAALLLVLQGFTELTLDDDVRKTIPELPDYGKTITLDELLHHTSGVRDYDLLLELQGSRSEDVATTDEALYLLAHQRGVNFAPGSRYLYSNAGYVLLSVVAQRLAAKPFAALVKERIFDPLGMTDSLVADDHARVVPGRAVGYRRKDDGGFEISMTGSERTGPGNVISTIRDLAKWDANFYAPKVGGQALVDAMRTTGKLEDGTPIPYAMGLIERQSHGLTVETHGGSAAGYRTAITRYPGERLTVTVLCNDASAKPAELGDKVAALFLPQLSASDAAAPAALGADPATLAGAYLNVEAGGLLVVDAKDGALQLRRSLHAKNAEELLPFGPGEMAVKGSPNTRLTFAPPAGKKPAQMLLRNAPGPADAFARIEPVESVPAATLAGYAGRYGSDEVTRDLVITVKDGKLYRAPLGRAPAKEPLQPVARDVFLLGNDGGDCAFERDARGNVKAVVFDTERAHGVRLERR
jgi:CubicO group peptidase (beta-lactamase class C family)